MDFYAVVDVECPAAEWRHLLTRAAERAALVEEISELRAAPPVCPADRNASTDAPVSPVPSPLLPAGRVPSSLKSFDDARAALQSLVEGIAAWTHTARVGLFGRSAQAPDRFVLRASLRPTPNLETWTACSDDPIPQWLARSLQFVARPCLSRLPNREIREVFVQALNDWGAEVVIPLQLHSELAGWLVLGGCVTGQSFDDSALLALAPVADHAATVLENVLLYESAAWHRALIEAVMQSMPTGVVVVDEGGVVRMFNEAAASVFGRRPDTALNQPVENIGSPLADLLRSALGGQAPQEPREWMEPGSRRQISAAARSL